jgi:monofunctional biosynthetic peptidoglycan transglycosylase
MHSEQIEGAFRRRRDRSLGWAAMESRQAAALARELTCSSSAPVGAMPPELLPFPLPTKRHLGFGDIVKGTIAWIIAIQLCYLLATSILIIAYRYVDPSATVLMAYREWRYGWKVSPAKSVKIAKVPRYVKSMLVAIEDDKFYVHHGIDMEAFARARAINKRLGKPVYGGSTLTMQVARTLFLVPEKSYVRKYLEVLTALELEAFLPKTRILELYFGYAEWGKGIFGMEAAARKWYGCGISSLSRDQAARLIALLSSPIKYNPETLRKSLILRERYAYLLNNYETPAGETASSAEAPSAATTASAAAVSPSAAGTAEVPPPSPEPGVDAETETESAPPAEPDVPSAQTTPATP